MVIRYEKLQYQIDLQRLYDRKHELERLLASIPAEQQQLQEQFKAHTDNYHQQKEHHRQLLAEQHGAESDLSGYEAQLAKKQGQMHEVKTNKEYQTALHEIEVLKQKIAETEERILLAMERVTEQEARLAGLKKALDEEEALHKERLSFLEQKLAAARSELAHIDPDIAALEKTGSPDLLAAFHRLLRVRGRAVVPVDERTCGGCHATLTPNKIELVKYGQQIEYCDNCQRVLYWPDEARQAEGKAV
ncbi:hypothetical protein HS125_06510 [bacterium]|nr:hypothetical protein [bacterium]